MEEVKLEGEDRHLPLLYLMELKPGKQPKVLLKFKADLRIFRIIREKKNNPGRN